MPRSRSSGALSMFSNAVKSALQPSVSERGLGDGSGQRGLAVVDVTDGTDVNMRLSALKLLLGHKPSS